METLIFPLIALVVGFLVGAVFVNSRNQAQYTALTAQFAAYVSSHP